MKPPAWANLLCAFGLFVYQSLDAIDGKQARRTNSSTPLGELFDHGCDAVSTGNFLKNLYTLKKKKILIKLFSICDLGNVCVAATWPVAMVHVFHNLHGHVYILHRPLADIRDWHAQVWQSGRHRGAVVHLHNLCPISTIRGFVVGDCCKHF